MFTRTAVRVVARAAPRGTRAASVDAGASDYFTKREAIRAHAAETTQLWRRISFYVCVPATIVCALWVRNVEAEHAEHTEHIKAEHDGHLPEIAPYEYMNRRLKPYPWGMNSLFFNPHVNKNLEDE
ncbi:COX6A, subunit VIa of cytochrome c oxidase [Suillus paluster]|uniref:COX6A, subunit VIa of cytochrome c oxidase n=1 Tax=Suillus paluster TaxID=48578 RepID=UPI001B877CCD|nr:COX6A, subunit VIa of cytochrome c oxidase [Suillus paluster]KAG1749893.1 COX6A, subunit VIa of cytochrome c oxidase [Suillus paluster]